MNISKAYIDRYIETPDGIRAQILDPSRIDFSNSVMARKISKILIEKAVGGEEIVTRNIYGQVETIYTTQPGDAIFNYPHCLDDRYVPADSIRRRWKYDDVLIRDDLNIEFSDGCTYLVGGSPCQVLPNVIDRVTCLENLWGQGQHQFLYPGATLVLRDNLQVSGVDQAAFMMGWELHSYL